MSYYDEDSHGRVRHDYDFFDENVDLQPDHVQEERRLGLAIVSYARFVARTSDVLPAHGAGCLNVLASKEGNARRQARVLHSWVRIDSFAEPSLCYEVSGDCGVPRHVRRHRPIYYVAPALGTIRWSRPDPAVPVFCLQDGYEFPGIAAPCHAPGKAKLGRRTIRDIFDCVIENHILPQHEFTEYEHVLFDTLQLAPSAEASRRRPPLPGWNYDPCSADGSWNLGVSQRRIEAWITAGLTRRAEAAGVVERMLFDAADLYCSF